MATRGDQLVSRDYHGIAAGAIVVLVTLGTVVAALPAVEEGVDYTQDAAEWCEDHGGELNNARVIGEHGGLHCEFPNGTSVHVDEVNASDEW